MATGSETRSRAWPWWGPRAVRGEFRAEVIPLHYFVRMVVLDGTGFHAAEPIEDNRICINCGAARPLLGPLCQCWGFER